MKTAIQSLKPSLNQSIIILFLLALWIYMVLRAINLSFTHDESLSFQIIIGDKGFALTANNHLLNSFLMRITGSIFGKGELALRLPNIFAFIIYGSFCFRILNRYKNTLLIFTGLALLLLNPYLIEFFSLARGYGLALGFTMGSLYYLLRLGDGQTYGSFIRNMSFSLGMSLMAALSNYSFLNLNIALLLIFSLELYLLVKNKKVHLVRKEKYMLALIYFLNTLILASFINHLFVLQNRGQLYFGGQSNFINATVTSLIDSSINLSDYGKAGWILGRRLVLLIFSLSLIYQIFRSGYDSLTRVTLILILMVFGSILQHYFFNILYPTVRTGLVFIPLFGLMVFYLIRHAHACLSGVYKRIFAIGVLTVIGLPLMYHFYDNLNLKYTMDWKYDANTKEVMNFINTYTQTWANKEKMVTVTTRSPFVPTMNYYRLLYSMEKMKPVERDEIIPNADFIYCLSEDADSLKAGMEYQVVQVFESTNSLLLGRINDTYTPSSPPL